MSPALGRAEACVYVCQLCTIHVSLGDNNLNNLVLTMALGRAVAWHALCMSVVSHRFLAGRQRFDSEQFGVAKKFA